MRLGGTFSGGGCGGLVTPHGLTRLLSGDAGGPGLARTSSENLTKRGDMSDVSDLSKEEMAAISEAIDLYEKLVEVLGRVEARPANGVLHIETEVQPGYLGWIGHNESGTVTFQPAPPDANGTEH